MESSSRAYWPIWLVSLRKQGVADLFAWFLDAAGPLNILGAQVLYLSQPFLPSTSLPGLRALAHLLEQEDEARDFSTLLKGKPL
jgi:hypothetical protein